MATEPLKITAKIYDGRLNSSDGLIFLDSILYHAWFIIHDPEVLEGTKKSNNQRYIGLPLKQLPNNRWAASLGQYKQYEETVEYWVKRPDFGKSFADSYLIDDINKVNVKSGHLKAYRTPQVIRIVSDITFYSVGNPEKINAMLSKMKYIGKKTAAGWGAVAEWVVEPCEADYSLIKDGKLMRPVPVDEAEGLEFDRDQTTKRMCAIRPPYWKHKNMALCYVPIPGGGLI